MKYIYQDSTELPVQRNFIEDLKIFLDITSRVIPLENSIIEIKCRHKEALSELNSRINGMNLFEEKLGIALKRLINEVDTEDLVPCANAILQTCNENLGKKRKFLKSSIKKLKMEVPRNIKNSRAKSWKFLPDF